MSDSGDEVNVLNATVKSLTESLDMMTKKVKEMKQVQDSDKTRFRIGKHLGDENKLKIESLESRVNKQDREIEFHKKEVNYLVIFLNSLERSYKEQQLQIDALTAQVIELSSPASSESASRSASPASGRSVSPDPEEDEIALAIKLSLFP
jgi:chromosome segregation ATPase